MSYLYKDTVIPIVKQVRDIVLPQFGFAEGLAKKSAVPGDVVTLLDIEVETFLRERLASAYPDISFVGEETGGDRDAESFWLVDPIDGTNDYIRGLPFCTTAIALIQNGEVVFSVVYDFVADVVYWAEKGKGAFKDETPIHVSARPLAKSFVAVEIQFAKPESDAILLSFFKSVTVVKTVSASWEFAMVACGKLDAKVSWDPWGYDYDFAPGSLLVREAGGIATNVGSTTYDYKNRTHVFSNKENHEALQKLITEGSR